MGKIQDQDAEVLRLGNLCDTQDKAIKRHNKRLTTLESQWALIDEEKAKKLIEETTERLEALHDQCELLHKKNMVAEYLAYTLEENPVRAAAAALGAVHAFKYGDKYWHLVDKTPLVKLINPFVKAGKEGRAPTLDEIKKAAGVEVKSV